MSKFNKLHNYKANWAVHFADYDYHKETKKDMNSDKRSENTDVQRD